MARTARWQIRVWRAVVTHGGSPQPWKTALIQCHGRRSNALLWSAYTTAVRPAGCRVWAWRAMRR
eukprot:5473014-Prorocentrum_lima.AAC.1